MLEPRQQVGAEPALLPIRARQGALRDQLAEKSLGQILSLMHVMPMATDEGVERIPIEAAEIVQCDRSFWRGSAAGQHHLRPEGRAKDGALSGGRFPYAVVFRTHAGIASGRGIGSERTDVAAVSSTAAARASLQPAIRAFAAFARSPLRVVRARRLSGHVAA